MIPLFKIEWIKQEPTGDLLCSAFINPDKIISVELCIFKNKSRIELHGGSTRFDVRKPEELNMALIVHCIKKS